MKPWPAIRHLERARRQLTKASIKLRAGIGTSPPDYYEMNRIWAQLDSLIKRMTTPRPARKGTTTP